MRIEYAQKTTFIGDSKNFETDAWMLSSLEEDPVGVLAVLTVAPGAININISTV